MDKKKEAIYETYCKKKEELEKKKLKRVIITTSFISIIIFAIFYINLGTINNMGDLAMLILGSIIFSIVDLYIHFVLFSFTLYKNVEDSLELESLEKEIFKNS